MATRYPTPEELGVRIPAHLIPERFRQGFEHGLRGGQLHRAEYLRRSFRAGFREAKLVIRELHRQRGVIPFPTKARMRVTIR
jgi:hypothetical protein